MPQQDSVRAQLLAQGILPILSPANVGEAEFVVRAAHLAGLGVLELTDRLPSFKDTFAELRKMVQSSDMRLLVGSVSDASTAHWFLDQGADGIVSPCGPIDAIAARCRRANLLYVPAFTTPSELNAALSVGAADGMQKFFPAAHYGPGYLREVLAPYSQRQSCIMITGGMKATGESLGEFLKIGAVQVVGMGSVINPACVAARDWAGVSGPLRSASELFRRLKSVEA